MPIAAGGLRARAPSRRTCRCRGRRARSRRSASRREAASGRRSRLPGGPQRSRGHRPAVGAEDRADVDDRLIRRRPGRRRRRAGGAREGDPRQRLGRAGARHGERRREDVRVRDAPRPRSRRARCRASRPSRARSRRGRCRPRSPATTPAAETFRDRLDQRVVAGSVCGPPPEKLITSMPSRTADSNAATISGVLRDVADRRRHVEDAVVAELRARRDAGEAGRHAGGRRRPARSCPRCRPRSRRRACRGTRPAGRRQRGPACPEPGAGNARATITFGVVHFVSPLREAGRVRVARRVEEGVRLVDAVVDDGDLHPLAVARRSPLRARSRRSGRAAVERERVAVARVELAREAESLRGRRQLRRRQARRPSRRGAIR